MWGRGRVVSPSSSCPSKSQVSLVTSLVCDQTWPPISTRTNAVLGTEDPKFHPNLINSPVLPRIFLRNLHVKLVMSLTLGDNPTSGWAGQVCLCPLHLTVTSGVTNPKKDGNGAEVMPDLKYKGVKGGTWLKTTRHCCHPSH